MRIAAAFALALAGAGLSFAATGQAAPAPTQTIAYGTDPAETLDFTRAQGVSGPALLIVFVHGGGWSRGSKDNATGALKAAHFAGEGYAFATIDYRLVPQARVEDEAQDVALALKALLARARELGIDKRRVVLMGHSAGAHLVALVGTDERYLKAAGLSFRDVAGVVPIDGAAYDVPQQLQIGAALMQQNYAAAFGSDPARQRALSPTFQAAAPNAPAFLLLHVQRPDGVTQNEALEAALRNAGTRVDRQGFPGTGLRGHMEINRRLGDPDYAPTAALDAWLQRLLG